MAPRRFSSVVSWYPLFGVPVPTRMSQHAIALLDDGLLVDAGVLVGPLEFRELVDVAAYFARQLPRVVFALDAHDDALGINGIDDAVAARQYHSTGVAGGDTFHAGAHDRSTGAEQWH